MACSLQTALLLAAALLAALAGSASAAQQIDWKWRTGARMSYYGDDDWSIHKGSCDYGYIGQNEPHGWDVVAISGARRPAARRAAPPPLARASCHR
jgi:hypothetical protein